MVAKALSASKDPKLLQTELSKRIFFFLLTHDFCSRKKEKEKIYQAHVTKLMNHPSENREVQRRTRECRPLPGVAVASFPQCLGAHAGAMII